MSVSETVEFIPQRTLMKMIDTTCGYTKLTLTRPGLLRPNASFAILWIFRIYHIKSALHRVGSVYIPRWRDIVFGCIILVFINLVLVRILHICLICYVYISKHSIIYVKLVNPDRSFYNVKTPRKTHCIRGRGHVTLLSFYYNLYKLHSHQSRLLKIFLFMLNHYALGEP